MRIPLLAVLIGLLLSPHLNFAADPVEVTLVSQSEKPLPIVIPQNASPRVRAAAETLASYLGKISSAEFAVVTTAQKSAIRIGLLADFPQAVPQEAITWEKTDPTRREDYWLRSHRQGLDLIGTTELAVEHAVWDLLHRLGYRQFFPGEHWEIIPKRSTLAIQVDVHEHPDYFARRIWYGFGPWDYAEEPYRQWCARNRCTSGIELRTGHAYDGILSRNKATFQKHPEYLGLLNGERKSSKLCISNPALRQLVIQDALKQLAENPEVDSISMDPSDGPGWCECEKCQAMGSVSDRALTLANEVAEAIQKESPGTYVGMYAYSSHSPPPNIKVHPQVIISVATAFIREGYTVDELMEGWHHQGATLGVREYYSVHTWDRDLPGRSRGSNLDYLTRTIPHFYQMGARFFSSESSDNWGPNGLGYYLASRMLWDIDAAADRETLVQDFLEKSFGSAREPMTQFYQLLDGSKEPLLSSHLIGQMYRLLREAKQLTENPAVQRRIEDLVLYTRYVELYFAYANAESQDRQAKFEALIRHAYRMRTTMMVHTKAVYRDIVRRDKQVSIPEDATWSVPEPRNPWKNSDPFSPQELDQLLQAGIDHHPLRGFDPVSFSTHLVPPEKLDLPKVSTGSMGAYSRGQKMIFTWVTDPSQPIRLTISGGKIYKDRGNVSITLHPAPATREQTSLQEWIKNQEPIASAEVPPDGEERPITLQPLKSGLHLITISDGSAGTTIQWPQGQPMTVISSLDQPATFHGRWSLYFYVPPGTKTVGGYSAGPGDLLDGSGKKVHTFAETPGYFQVPVEADQQGTLWKFEHTAGQRILLTVPPCLARSAQELLLPEEVVQPAQQQ